MKKMSIYEPAMCCSTGLCGVGVDPELLRISTVLNTLKQNGIEVSRYNLASAPMEFVHNKAVHDFIEANGPDKLPVVLLDGSIILSGRYPTNAELTELFGLPDDLLSGQDAPADPAEQSGGCCCDGGCC
jgi:hypothetical protein